MKSSSILSSALVTLLFLTPALAHSVTSEVLAKDYVSIQYASTKAKTATDAKGKNEEELVSPDRWPTQIPTPRNTRLREITSRDDKKDGLTRYQTINFQFTSEVPLSEDAQERVGELFECAYAAVVAMSRVIPIERATRKRPSKNKFRAELYENMASYYAAGGPQGSAGVFKWSSNARGGRMKEENIKGDKVMLPFDHLGINAQGEISEKEIDSHTLVHEITHQFTCLNNLPVWANEGFSEYVGYVPYADGVLDFDQSFEKVVQNGKRRMSGGEAIEYPFTLEEFFLMSKDDMYEYMGNRVDTYYLSLMCVTYFVHLGEENGIRAFKSYLKDLLRGKKNDEKLLKKLYARMRTAEAVQKDFIEAWEARGVKVSFKDVPDPRSRKRR